MREPLKYIVDRPDKYFAWTETGLLRPFKMAGCRMYLAHDAIILRNRDGKICLEMYLVKELNDRYEALVQFLREHGGQWAA